ncbi:MAG: hypothetical protein MUQ00_03675 [Candidatus Aminicenantes bacterium]|nr:hypothetical protein [Candidatus Aminicenantes bacterium]
MRFEFKPSFDRSAKSLPPAEKTEIIKLCLIFVDTIAGADALSKGVGLKRLRGDYWEIRKGIKYRVLLRWKGDLIEFVLAGSHDEVRKYLKNA